MNYTIFQRLLKFVRNRTIITSRDYFKNEKVLERRWRINGERVRRRERGFIFSFGSDSFTSRIPPFQSNGSSDGIGEMERKVSEGIEKKEKEKEG